MKCGDIDGKGTICCFYQFGLNRDYCNCVDRKYVAMDHECHCLKLRQAELRRQLEAGETK